jgi:hypothetical protein
VEKELTYEACFPGRFLTAGHFKGKKVTLTISDAYLEDLEAAKDSKKAPKKPKPPKLVLSFEGKKLELVIPKTNAYCIKMMFGSRLEDWVNKRVTFFPSTCRFGAATVDCIRVFGSPDIAADMPLSVPQGRQSPIEMTMHATGTKAAAKVEQAQDVDPAVSQAWSALGYSREAGTADMNAYTGTDYLAHLGALIDQQNAGNA